MVLSLHVRTYRSKHLSIDRELVLRVASVFVRFSFSSQSINPFLYAPYARIYEKMPPHDVDMSLSSCPEYLKLSSVSCKHSSFSFSLQPSAIALISSLTTSSIG